jgi:hypothetical protein
MALFGDKVHTVVHGKSRRAIVVNTHNRRNGKPLSKPWVVFEDKPSFPTQVTWDELKPGWPRQTRTGPLRPAAVAIEGAGHGH